MKQSSWFVSLLLTMVLVFNTACSSTKSSRGNVLLPIIETGSSMQKYNLQLDFMKHHFSGLLIVKRLSGDEIRILASTHFGLSLFDFSLHGEIFRVNSCIEPMKKEKVLRLLEMDLKNLFLSTSNMRIKKKEETSEKRISGKGFAKSVFYLSANPSTQVKIKHPWIRLTLQLDPLEASSDSSIQE